jgi:uncharacterized membrane protein
MTKAYHPSDREARDDRQFERLVFFSDAVFAIAITLLVLDLRAIPGPHGELQLATAVPGFFSFALSFAVIGRYWLAHHSLFGALRREDAALRATNFVFLFAVVFLPFPTKMLNEYKMSTTSVVFYALSVATVGLLQVLLCFVARRPALMRPGETRGGTARFAVRALVAPVIFIVSVAGAWPEPRVTALLWILIVPASLATNRLAPMLQRRIDARTVARAST